MIKHKIESALKIEIKEFINSKNMPELKKNQKYIIFICVDNFLHAISETKNKNRIETMDKGNSSLLNGVYELYKNNISINYFYITSENNKNFYINILKNKEFVKLVNKNI